MIGMFFFSKDFTLNLKIRKKVIVVFLEISRSHHFGIKAIHKRQFHIKLMLKAIKRIAIKISKIFHFKIHLLFKANM